MNELNVDILMDKYCLISITISLQLIKSFIQTTIKNAINYINKEY